MPSGVAGLPSWVMIMRAAWPSGERNSFRPRWKLGVVEGFRGQVEGVVVLGGVEGLAQAVAFFSASADWASVPELVA